MKSKEIPKNYLERKPMRAKNLSWSINDKGIVTVEVENKGVANKLAQKFFKKPKVTYVHLDEIGSFIWPRLDGKTDLVAIGKELEKELGDKCNPLYERLAKYISILESYKFVSCGEK